MNKKIFFEVIGRIGILFLSVVLGGIPIYVFNNAYPWMPEHAAAHEFIATLLVVLWGTLLYLGFAATLGDLDQ